MSKISNSNDNPADNSETNSATRKPALSRRELLRKCGAYTAPTVVILALPSTVYGHNYNGTSLSECIALEGGAMAFSHCTGMMGMHDL
jgi:hypothetical protein